MLVRLLKNIWTPMNPPLRSFRCRLQRRFLWLLKDNNPSKTPTLSSNFYSYLCKTARNERLAFCEYCVWNIGMRLDISESHVFPVQHESAVGYTFNTSSPKTWCKWAAVTVMLDSYCGPVGHLKGPGLRGLYWNQPLHWDTATVMTTKYIEVE